MDCSEKIRSLRKQKNITQSELGHLIGVSNRAISKWENGISSPTGDKLLRLSEIFNVPMESFFENSVPAKQKKITSASGMEPLSELYRIGRGPSSSHTMGPEKACLLFSKKNPDADHYRVILYGSLAKTGTGHGTDKVIRETLAPIPTDIEKNITETNLPHPNTMDFFAYKKGKEIDHLRILSVGGGRITTEGTKLIPINEIYPHTSFAEIFKYCTENSLSLWQYADRFEGPQLWIYLSQVWETMKSSIKSGLKNEGILPGGLNVQRKAKYLISQHHIDESPETRENRIVCAYAFAVSEENASGNIIVTAPTCGSAGVVPAVLYYLQQKRGFNNREILQALAAGGIIGNLIKTNASISGAECGCQAEIGSACAMAAASVGQLLGLDLEQIEYAAEIAIEHHLGLTCDPVCGLVQIPCIERNAVAAMRALNAVSLANFLSKTRKISLDKVIITMRETGLDMSRLYRETSEGGLARFWSGC